jgi:hypothetical protein
VASRVRALAARTNRPDALEALRSLSERFPADGAVEIDEFTSGPDGTRLRGRAPTPEAVEALRRTLDGVDPFARADVAEVSPAPEGGEVTFRLSLEGRAAAGPVRNPAPVHAAEDGGVES